MQISKSFPAVCAAAVCVSFITVRAEDTPAQTAARAAMMETMNALEAQPAQPAAPQTQPVAISPVKPAPPAVKPEVVSRVNQFNGNYPGKELGLKPIQAPPLPISAAKQAQLQGLLDSYRADQITPEQYHTQRAKILAEP